MMTFRTRTIARAFGLYAGWSVVGCGFSEHDPAELGVYDPAIRAGKPERPGADADLPDPTPPPISQGETPPVVHDAGAPVLPGPSAQSVSTVPIVYDDAALRCYDLTAHAANDPASPYLVPITPDHYVRFTFVAPWTGTEYVRSFEPLIFDASIIHHATLFENRDPVPEGVAVPSELIYPGAQLVYAWDPGVEPLYFQPDVGMRVTGGASYTLEIHYNNLHLEPTVDRSGVKLCVTPTAPTYVVSLSRLGTQLTVGMTATGTCTSESSDPITLLTLRPQMGIYGRRAKVVVHRPGGDETYLDEPFMFDDTTVYPTNLKLLPGESMTTTCTYSERVMPGPGVSDERCDLFAIHWPADTLVNARSFAVDGWVNTCFY